MAAMSNDTGRGGTLPDEQMAQVLQEYTQAPVLETPEGSYRQADVDQIDQAYEKGNS